MQLNDAVPERRNLIVFCLTTLIFFLGGADACGDIKLPLMGIKLTTPSNLVFIYWAIFCYLVLRYWSIYKVTPYNKNSTSFEKFESYDTALKYVIKNHIKANTYVRSVKWFEKQSKKSMCDFQTKYEEIGLSEPPNLSHIQYQTTELRNIGKIDIALHYKASVDGKKIMISEPLNIFRTKPHILLFAIIKNSFRDKYIFDWVFPWLLLVFTILVIAYNWLYAGYQVC